jgi:hypothetical protein
MKVLAFSFRHVLASDICVLDFFENSSMTAVVIGVSANQKTLILVKPAKKLLIENKQKKT